ncbi:hypothetical protein ACVDG5_035030 [Mesorhizobium sp. ORM6]
MARSNEALKQKARRPNFSSGAIGTQSRDRNRIEKDPDRRVRKAIDLILRRFHELQSIRQVHLWLRREGIMLMAVNYMRTVERVICREAARLRYGSSHSRQPDLHRRLCVRRTGSKVTIEDGRQQITPGFRRDRAEWEPLLVDHREDYLSWHDFEMNQRLITDNATSKGLMPQGALRWGELLLGGLFRCGPCGRKLHVSYSGSNGNTGRIIAAEPSSTMEPIYGSASRRCVSIKRSARRFFNAFNRSVSKRQPKPSRPPSCRLGRSGVS